MQFMIHTSSGSRIPDKFRVPSVAAIIAGTWNEPTGENLAPDRLAVRAGLPHRWRKAFDRALFWFDKESRFDGERFHKGPPYATLYGSRGAYLATVYALPCADEPERPS